MKPSRSVRRLLRGWMSPKSWTSQYIAAMRLDPCPYCGGPGGTIDHVRPKRRGGQNVWHNYSGACASCNHRKGHRKLLFFVGGFK